MPLPRKSDLQTLDYTWRGLPFAQVEAKPLQTGTLDITWRGLPFYAAPGGVVTRWYYQMIAQQRLGS